MTRNIIISLSDRTRNRNVALNDGDSVREAIQTVVGSRLVNIRHDSSSMDGTSSIYDVTVATGRSRGGVTPVRSIRAYVRNA